MVIRSGDVILSGTRPNLNAVALVPRDLDNAICSTGFCVLRAKPEIDPRYLFHYVQSPSFVGTLSQLVKGALYPAVTDKQVRAQWIPVPPLEEQRRIAGEIREKFERIDQARVAAAAQLEAARALPAAYLREVFDSPEAQKWPTKALAETAELLPSKSIATAGDTEVRAITTACLTEQGFDAGGIKLARMWSADAAESIVRTGEVLIARSNTSELVGRAATYNGELSGVVASDLTVRIMPQQDVLYSEFLGRYLSYLYLTGFWKERAGGASGSMKKITRTQILRLKVPVPTTEDQGRICARLGSQLNGFKSLAAAIAGEGQAIATMQNAILRKVFNGEV